MYRLLPPLMVMFLLVQFGCGGQDAAPTAVKRGGPTETFPPQMSRFYTVDGKAGKLAAVTVWGNGKSGYMGVYVYDKYGNCVAWDDDGTIATRDTLAVEWTPALDGVYTVEVRNNGTVMNECEVIDAVRSRPLSHP